MGTLAAVGDVSNTLRWLSPLLAAYLTSCSLKEYASRRGADLADAFTCAFGVGGGAKARLGPLQLGLFFNRDYAGIRGGTAGWFSPEMGEAWIQETSNPIGGEDRFYECDAIRRDKAYWAVGVFMISTLFWKHPDDPYYDLYYADFEMAVGAGGTVRLGVNPVELVDFLLGVFFIDILYDDQEDPDSRPSADDKGVKGEQEP